MTGDELLFVYGTLRRGCGSAEACRLHEEVTWLGQARTRGRLYRVDWYPALVVEAAPATRWVVGDLFRLSDPATTLAWLDRYEECGPDFPQPQDYRRVLVEVVRVADRAREYAWVYSFQRSVAGLPLVAGGDWFSA